MPSPLSQSASDLDQEFVDNVIGKHTGRPGALLAILQQVENRHPRKYLPLEMLGYSAARLRISLARTYSSVATFFALFNLEPQGRNTVSVRRGTACHSTRFVTQGSRSCNQAAPS